MDEVQNQQNQQDAALSASAATTGSAPATPNVAIATPDVAPVATEAVDPVGVDDPADQSGEAHPGLGMMARIRAKIAEWDEDLHAELHEDLARIEAFFGKSA